MSALLSGKKLPSSHRPMVLRCRPRAWANCCWVRCWRLRNCLSNIPKVSEVLSNIVMDLPPFSNICIFYEYERHMQWVLPWCTDVIRENVCGRLPDSCALFSLLNRSIPAKKQEKRGFFKAFG